MKDWNCTCEAGYRGEVIHCPLHAAAPDMYEALKETTKFMLEHRALEFATSSESYQKAQRALAKVENK